MKKIWEITIILSASIGLSLMTNWLSPYGIPLIGQWDISKGIVSAKMDNPYETSILEIDDVITAKKIYDQGGTIFVDARSDASYAEKHIKGAISLPAGDIDNRIDEFLNRIPIKQPIVAYCSGRTCEDSHRLAQMLVDFGYEHVSVMIDGFPGWEARDFPVD